MFISHMLEHFIQENRIEGRIIEFKSAEIALPNAGISRMRAQPTIDLIRVILDTFCFSS